MIYKTSFIYRHKHFSTIVPALWRKTPYCEYQREEYKTPDQDFFHVDKLINKSNSHAVILLHGLEGSSTQHYIQSHALAFFSKSFDIYAMNFRSCSGTMNNTAKLYHSGETEDLGLLINSLISNEKYTSISLIGLILVPMLC